MVDRLLLMVYGIQTVVQYFSPVGVTAAEKRTWAWITGRRIGMVTTEAFTRMGWENPVL